MEVKNRIRKSEAIFNEVIAGLHLQQTKVFKALLPVQHFPEMPCHSIGRIH